MKKKKDHFPAIFIPFSENQTKNKSNSFRLKRHSAFKEIPTLHKDVILIIEQELFALYPDQHLKYLDKAKRFYRKEMVAAGLQKIRSKENRLVMEWIETKIKEIEAGKKEKTDKNLNLTFRDLCDSDEDYRFYISMLQNVEPPVIDLNKNFLLKERSKSALAAFIYVLRGKIHMPDGGPPNDEVLANILEKEFNDFTIAGKTLSNFSSRAFDKYREPFGQLLRRRN